jgi:hypothetical protein
MLETLERNWSSEWMMRMATFLASLPPSSFDNKIQLNANVVLHCSDRRQQLLLSCSIVPQPTTLPRATVMVTVDAQNVGLALPHKLQTDDAWTDGRT